MGKIDRIRQRGDRTKDDVLYDAGLRNRQTLSEATQQLPEAIKADYPAIPWKQISGFRNILVHNYLGDVDAQTVLMVVRQHLPPLASAVRSMLAQNHADEA